MTAPDNSAALLAAIVASSDDAIVSKDLGGYVTSWNRAAERMFGYTADEMIGQHITRIIPDGRIDEEDYVLSRVRSGLSVDHFETMRRRKDGSMVDVSLTVSPVRNASGRIIGASKIARDITEQKQLRRALEEASRAKDEFLATLSHELRTPLNTVLGYIQMLRSGSVPDRDFSRALDIVGRNAEALTQLVNDLLDTSRIVTGKVELTLRDCDLSQVLEEALATVAPMAISKGIGVQATIARPLLLRGDPDRLRQVFWNLLANAVKFTPRGGHLRVTAAVESEMVHVTIEDDGVGIAPEALQHVFNRFWQAAQNRSSGGQSGLGLGLALVRNFVELHGGQVAAHSRGLGHGARFEVVLPVATAVAAE
jgi:PAS domain S-box-containing protein